MQLILLDLLQTFGNFTPQLRYFSVCLVFWDDVTSWRRHTPDYEHKHGHQITTHPIVTVTSYLL